MKLPQPAPVLTFLLFACGLAASALSGAVPGERPFHQPITLDAPDFTPRPQVWEEPRRLGLPSAEQLHTVEIRDRVFQIKRVSPRAKLDRATRDAVANTPGGLAVHENPEEALFFLGSGGGGRFSSERLIIENCTFIIDFEEGDFESWDPRRSAVYVEGYKEVIVRNSVFISKATPFDPMRKVIASVTAYDCLRVEVEDSYFEGRTIGWRGHLNIFCCGPTSIRNVEVNGLDRAAGGIWVATGVGEGKIGWVHQDAPEKMIYPPGPLLIENTWVRDQKGNENSDGIYIQSVQPYLIRNTKVENWGPDDSLIDVGFRDTAGKTHGGRPLANHGGLGLIEHSEFAKGYIKDSVGIGGGLVFRYNLLRDGAWFFPYVFDGGSWFVVSNEFRDHTGVIVSGRNNQLSGWTPREGMFINGSQMVLFNNLVRGRPGVAPRALFVAGAAPGPLKDVIRSDFNAYAFDTPPAVWGLEPGDRERYATLEDWRAATGNDRHSILAPDANVTAFASVPPETLTLPGGIPMRFGPFRAGLTGPVGVQHAATRERAARASAAVAAEYARKYFDLEVETMKLSGDTPLRTERRTWASGGAYLAGPVPAGSTVELLADFPSAERFLVSTVTPGSRRSGRFQFLVNGQPLGEPFTLERRRTISHGVASFQAGPQRFAYRSLGPGPEGGFELIVDTLNFRAAAPHEREQARQARVRAEREAARARQAELDARKIRFPVNELRLASPAPGTYSAAEVRDTAYRVFVPRSSPARLAWRMPAPPAPGRFAVFAVFFQQQDRAQVQLLVDGTPAGQGPVRVSANTRLGEVDLPAGEHVLALEFSGFNPGAKLRLQRIELLPLDQQPAPDDDASSS